MTEKSKDLTIPNPLHYIGEHFKSPETGINSLGYGAVLGLIGLFIATEGSIQTLTPDSTADNQGTELFATTLADHEKALTTLKDQAYMIAKINVEQEFNKLSPDETKNYETTKNTFTENAQQVLFDLYTKGATNNEAAISEQAFDSLHKRLINLAGKNLKIRSIKYNLGNVVSDMLDECIATTSTPKNATKIAQFNTVSNIQSCMAEHQSDNSNDFLLELLLLSFGQIGRAHV